MNEFRAIETEKESLCLSGMEKSPIDTQMNQVSLYGLYWERITGMQKTR